MRIEAFIHESAYIDKDVNIGKGTKIWHFAHVQSGARIGENCVLGQNVNIGKTFIWVLELKSRTTCQYMKE